MIGVVVVSHGQLAKEFVAAAEHVLGPQSQMLAVSIGPDDDMELRRRDVLEAVKAVDDGSGLERRHHTPRSTRSARRSGSPAARILRAAAAWS